MFKFKGGALESARTIRFGEYQLDEKLLPGFVLVRNRHLSICGSDVDYWKYNGKVPPNYFLIHEVGGVVEETGPGVTDVQVGDQVWVNPLWADFSLPHNRRLHELGFDNLIKLPHHKFLATPPVQGALRDRMIWPSHLLHKIDNTSVNPEMIPLIEPYACSFDGCNLLDMESATMFGEWTAVVVGPGPIGVMVAEILLSRGCSRVFLLGRTEGRLVKAKRVLSRLFDADRIVTLVNSNGSSIVETIRSQTEHNRGAEVMIDCSGDEAVLTPAMAYLSERGQIVVIGRMLHGIGFERPEAQRGEKGLKLSYRFTAKAIESAKDHLFGPKAVHLEDVITHRFPLERAAEAFGLAAQKPPEVIKVLITCDA